MVASHNGSSWKKKRRKTPLPRCHAEIVSKHRKRRKMVGKKIKNRLESRYRTLNSHPCALRGWGCGGARGRGFSSFFFLFVSFFFLLCDERRRPDGGDGRKMQTSGSHNEALTLERRDVAVGAATPAAAADAADAADVTSFFQPRGGAEKHVGHARRRQSAPSIDPSNGPFFSFIFFFFLFSFFFFTFALEIVFVSAFLLLLLLLLLFS